MYSLSIGIGIVAETTETSSHVELFVFKERSLNYKVEGKQQKCLSKRATQIILYLHMTLKNLPSTNPPK